MSYWNHRVVKETLNGVDWYTVRETYYNADGTIYAYTEDAADASGTSIEELREYLTWLLAALDEPVLVDGEVKFVDYEEDDSAGIAEDYALMTGCQ